MCKFVDYWHSRNEMNPNQVAPLFNEAKYNSTHALINICFKSGFRGQTVLCCRCSCYLPPIEEI